MEDHPYKTLSDEELHHVFDREVKFFHFLPKRFQITLPDFRMLMDDNIDQLFKDWQSEIRNWGKSL